MSTKQDKTMIFPAYIKSGAYILNENGKKQEFTSIQDAWDTLKAYVTIKHQAIVELYGEGKETVEINEALHKITIKRIQKDSLTDGTELSSYVAITDPVILNPLSANIQLED